MAASCTQDERVQGQLVEVLERWFVQGREPAKGPDAPTEVAIDAGDAEAEPEA